MCRIFVIFFNTSYVSKYRSHCNCLGILQNSAVWSKIAHLYLKSGINPLDYCCVFLWLLAQQKNGRLRKKRKKESRPCPKNQRRLRRRLKRRDSWRSKRRRRRKRVDGDGWKTPLFSSQTDPHPSPPHTNSNTRCRVEQFPTFSL